MITHPYAKYIAPQKAMFNCTRQDRAKLHRILIPELRVRLLRHYCHLSSGLSDPNTHMCMSQASLDSSVTKRLTVFPSLPGLACRHDWGAGRGCEAGRYSAVHDTVGTDPVQQLEA